jgi:hypothetical protein
MSNAKLSDECISMAIHNQGIFRGGTRFEQMHNPGQKSTQINEIGGAHSAVDYANKLQMRQLTIYL